MDLRHMRHFVAVAEELHFGRAAKRLNIAQPPLSQSIQRLEADLGVELFDRSRRSVELTDAGRVFFGEAQRTLRQAELACKMAQREAARAPEIRVSFIGPAMYHVLPELLVRHRVAATGVSVRLIETSSPAQVDGICAGDFDIGFLVGGTQIDVACEMMVVERAGLVAAIPADWPLAGQGSITVAELAEQPFIMPPRKYAMLPQKYAAQASEMLNMFQRAGLMPHVTQEVQQTNATLSLVGAGVGCSLVMATAALTQPRNVKFLPVEDAASFCPWEMVMVWHPERISRLAVDFLVLAKTYVQENMPSLGLGEAAD